MGKEFSNFHKDLVEEKQAAIREAIKAARRDLEEAA
jgi:hypothetical protein